MSDMLLYAERYPPTLQPTAPMPPLIFLHGLSGSRRYWYRLLPYLQELPATSYLVDLLGFGRSPKPDLAYSVNDHLDALTTWRAAAGLAARPSIVIGHSLGALLALAWADRASAITGLVLIGLPLHRDRQEAQRRMAHLSLLHWLSLASRPLAEATCEFMCHTRHIWLATAPLLAPHLPAAVAHDALLHTKPSFFGSLDHVIYDSDLTILSQQARAIPTLFLHGADDATAPLAPVRDFATTRDHAQLTTIPGGHHDLPLSHPAEVAQAISHFLASMAPVNQLSVNSP